jgi:hypothetical protein
MKLNDGQLNRAVIKSFDHEIGKDHIRALIKISQERPRKNSHSVRLTSQLAISEFRTVDHFIARR